ncbi:hypothetical protein [Oscillatoria salina]|uniref:hypothetical protein n=1 Tax=Oscillatoria salina TaxID=331517 RepID=UPI0013BCA47D|nr:hypothetical protein [Oscillatoria salina]MBZ8181058.1 hypothetical protein [Oscillatoria salina IIICB1]NET91360.1 hypothetical protein [Kamptonema sp. SIO1D9]
MRSLQLRILTTLLPLLTAASCAPTTSSKPELATPTPQTKQIRQNQQNSPEISVSVPLENQWTPELEAEFQQRAKQIIAYHANSNYGNTHGENEKRSYPKAMFDFLAGNRDKAISFLQQEDIQAEDNRHTQGIDYYYAFTLKGQIRKYFFFGENLDPAYKQRMFEGAKTWTEKDPNGRPHPIYGEGKGGEGWEPEIRGGWVDGRNTDGLRAMRETAIYLMAEETGNENTRQLYKEKLQRYVGALYNIGMGEWDSETYHGHTFAAYLNLYDFAQDPEVKALAKAGLDWMSAAAALKYYRGGFGGPSKRDYGYSNVVFGSSAARTFWLYFGDTTHQNPDPELDTLHLITSSYRPPLAVVALARKQFDKPVEILATKPLYENWQPGNDRQPGYWETNFFANTYQMGSIAGTFPDADLSPFKLMADNSQRGVDYFVVNTGGGWVRPGKNPGDRIGQYRNLLIWLRPANQPFFFQLPETAKAEIEEGIWFFQLENTWLAVQPINLSSYTKVSIPKEKFAQQYSAEQTLQATATGNNYAGFVLEVGERESYGSYEDFQQAVKSKSRLDLSSLDRGKVQLRGANGSRLELTLNSENELPLVVRNGTIHNWSKNFAIYNPTNGNLPIYLGWKIGNLQIKAGDLSFEATVTGY